MISKAKRKKIIVTAVCAVLLALMYYVIFRFSAQDGEQSSSLSQRITERGVGFVNSLSGSRWSEIMLVKMVERYERPLRKFAHFAEYACMGMLVYILWSQWLERGRRLWLLTVGWVFLSAAGDEIHQFFVPGRYASPIDVLLDACGGAFGMLLCICIAALCRRHRIKKANSALAKIKAVRKQSNKKTN